MEERKHRLCFLVWAGQLRGSTENHAIGRVVQRIKLAARERQCGEGVTGTLPTAWSQLQSLTICVTSDKSPHLSLPQFLHLFTGL